MRDYHYGVYIGRFQPLHIGHELVIREALGRVETLIVIVGSSRQARTPVNPFTFDERRDMIRSAFAHEIASGRLLVVPMMDHERDSDWVNGVKTAVNDAILEHGNKGGFRIHGTNDFKVALAGYGKDASSFYLNMFPEWGSIQITTQHGTINASDIRHDYIRKLPRLPHDAVSLKNLHFLKDFSFTDAFKDLVAYKDALIRDKERFGTGPFLCADALVTHRGKVLLIERGGPVGRHCLAMPGGFVENNERLLDASLRELNEETRLDGANIKDFLVGHFPADNPKRSLRGRVMSMVYYYAIPDEVEVARPEGADDASSADWYSFKALPPERFFEDHHTVISNILSEVLL